MRWRGSGIAKSVVTLRRRLRHARADQQHEVGLLDPRPQLRIGREADLAGISWDARRRKRSPAGTSPRRAARIARRSGQNRRWPSRSSPVRRGWRSAARRPPASVPSSRHLRRARPDRNRLRARGVDGLRRFCQHVLGQRDHHRAGPPLHRDVKGALDDFGDLRRGSRSPSPIWRSSRKRRDSPSPERRRGRASPARPGR